MHYQILTNTNNLACISKENIPVFFFQAISNAAGFFFFFVLMFFFLSVGPTLCAKREPPHKNCF